MKNILIILTMLLLSNINLKAQKLLELIDAEKAGIDFKNTIKESGKYNHVIWDYVYNGGGVAIGDINNDGLADVFFTGNQVNDKLYLNKGSFQFEDISANLKSNTPHFWSSGVTMADVNADGWLDIYVCRFEPSNNPQERRNLLYINDAKATIGGLGASFTERAEEFGLSDTGFSVQSAFFDYDNDGDLDCFVVNQPPSNNIEKMQDRLKPSVCTEYSNKLYRNNSPLTPDGGTLVSPKVKLSDSERTFLDLPTGKAIFSDITIEAGLESCSYGLGLAIADLNNDGWQDIYVTNDYFVSDFAFINQKGQKPFFINQDKKMFKHESLYSMGVDIADFNNDGLNDVFTVDMSAADHYRNKANMASMNTTRFDEIIQNFNHQYMFNALQVNNGNDTFSEIAQLAGLANTDWSWSSLFIDIDNDSNKDIFVTNGIKRDIRFVDGMNKIRDMVASGQIKLSEIINAVPSQKLKNYAFQNSKDLKFKNNTDEWGFGIESFSNGMAYGDLDNDGDLDLIINNVDDLPLIFKNNSTQNYLKIKLKGKDKNTYGLGAKASIFYQNQIQTLELNPTRGYLSASEPILHFGLANISKVDSVIVRWNEKSISKVINCKANQVLYIDENKANQTINHSKSSSPILKEVSIKNLNFIHKESDFNDFSNEVLLPNKLSSFGPAMAVGDADNNGFEDVFLGGGKGQKSQVFYQNKDSSFKTEFFDDENQEKTNAQFFDANKDGKLDLYIACASNEYATNSPELQDIIYINQSGKLVADTTILPAMRFSTGAVAIDKTTNTIFVGGMMQQQKYPFATNSFFVETRHDLSEIDKKKLATPGFGNEKDKAYLVSTGTTKFDLGMIRDAIFSDYDQDGDQDLIAVGEWTKIQILENINGKYAKKIIPSLEKTTGFWHSVKAKDFDNDGDEDYILGNLGLNNKFKKDEKKHFHVFSSDFDGNGINDVVLSKEDEKGTLLPVRGRECSSQQMPFISQKIKSFDEFAKSTLTDIYSKQKLDSALHYEIDEMGSVYLENLGNGNFKSKLLPTQAQFSVISDMIIDDFDKDGFDDILTIGNKYEAEVETARYDASIGLLLKGNGKGDFSPISVAESGFAVNENTRKINKIKIGEKTYILVAVNNGTIRTFELLK